MKILLSSNKQIIKSFLEENSKIGFIPTASELDNDRWYMEKDKKDLIEMKYNITNIEITSESKEEILKKLNSVDAIFVAGGNCFYLLQQLKQKDIIQELIEFANNKIYIGSSAGSCIACPSINYVSKLDDKEDAPLLNDYHAMNLIDKYILPHYKSDEEYTKLINEIIEDYPNLQFITLTNEQAIIVNNQDDYKIIDTE